MKKIVQLFIIHYSLLIVACYPQVSTWSRVLGGPEDDAVYTVFQTRDNGFLAIGDKKITNSHIYQTYVVKFDYWGTILWQKLYGDSLNGSYTYSGVEDPYGNFYIAYNQGTCKLMKTDSYGNVLWIKSYPTNIQEFGCIRFNTDRRSLLIDCVIDFPVYYYTTGLLKLDTTGNLIWVKQYNDSLPYFSHFNSLSVSSDSYYIAGNIGFTFATSQGLLLKIDTTGNLVWKKIFTNGVKVLNATVECTPYTFISAGMYYNSVDVGAYCVRFNSNGDTLWGKNYISDSVSHVFTIAKTADNNFVIGGGSYNGSVKVLKFDSSGNKIFVTHNYYSPMDLVFYQCINSVRDSGLIIASQYSKPPLYDNDWLIVKTDKYGNTTPIGIKNYSENVPVNISVSTYPNPFNSTLNIKLSINKKSILSVKLYNILGQEYIIYENKKFDTGEHTIKLNSENFNFSSGVYFLKIYNNEVSISKKIIYLK